MLKTRSGGGGGLHVATPVRWSKKKIPRSCFRLNITINHHRAAQQQKASCNRNPRSPEKVARFAEQQAVSTTTTLLGAAPIFVVTLGIRNETHSRTVVAPTSQGACYVLALRPGFLALTTRHKEAAAFLAGQARVPPHKFLVSLQSLTERQATVHRRLRDTGNRGGNGKPEEAGGTGGDGGERGRVLTFCMSDSSYDGRDVMDQRIYPYIYTVGDGASYFPQKRETAVGQ